MGLRGPQPEGPAQGSADRLTEPHTPGPSVKFKNKVRPGQKPLQWVICWGLPRKNAREHPGVLGMTTVGYMCVYLWDPPGYSLTSWHSSSVTHTRAK